MPRHHATPAGNVPFTPVEEVARDAEAAQNAVDRAAKDAADATEVSEIDPIKAALLGPDPLTAAQIKRALRYLFKRNS